MLIELARPIAKPNRRSKCKLSGNEWIAKLWNKPLALSPRRARAAYFPLPHEVEARSDAFEKCAASRRLVKSWASDQAYANSKLETALDWTSRFAISCRSNEMGNRFLAAELRQNGIRPARRGSNEFLPIVKLIFGPMEIPSRSLTDYASVIRHFAKHNNGMNFDQFVKRRGGISKIVKADRQEHRKAKQGV